MTTTLPWTEKEKNELILALRGSKPFKIFWPWAPFHRVGFQALKWAAENKVSKQKWNEIVENLSCPAAPPKFIKRLKKAKLLDLEDRMTPLDPSLFIKKTFEMSQENIEAFGQKHFLYSINDLQALEPETTSLWRPILGEEMAEIREWLKYDQSLLKSFHRATPWNQLKIIESLIGSMKSYSILNFERIY